MGSLGLGEWSRHRNFNGIVVGSTLIESLQISRLKTRSLLSTEIETAAQVIACTWE